MNRIASKLSSMVKAIWGLGLFLGLGVGPAYIARAEFHSYFFGLLYGVGACVVVQAVLRHAEGRHADRRGAEGVSFLAEIGIVLTVLAALWLGFLAALQWLIPNFIYHVSGD